MSPTHPTNPIRLQYPFARWAAYPPPPSHLLDDPDLWLLLLLLDKTPDVPRGYTHLPPFNCKYVYDGSNNPNWDVMTVILVALGGRPLAAVWKLAVTVYANRTPSSRPFIHTTTTVTTSTATTKADEGVCKTQQPIGRYWSCQRNFLWLLAHTMIISVFVLVLIFGQWEEWGWGYKWRWW